jgi:hypothetical protein
MINATLLLLGETVDIEKLIVLWRKSAGTVEERYWTSWTKVETVAGMDEEARLESGTPSVCRRRGCRREQARRRGNIKYLRSSV